MVIVETVVVVVVAEMVVVVVVVVLGVDGLVLRLIGRSFVVISGPCGRSLAELSDKSTEKSADNSLAKFMPNLV